MSNILLVLIPVCILGIFWYSMIVNQVEHKFHQQKSIELNEVVSGIKQRIKTINLELSVEKQEPKYASYTFSKDYNSDLLGISNRLSSMIEKYYLLHSVYFYDQSTGIIYSSMSGRYDFNSFYDTQWLNDTENIYQVQQLPLRLAFNNESVQNKTVLFSEYNRLVLSLVIKGRPDFYLIGNISVNRLFTDVTGAYDLNRKNEEFFFISPEGKLLEGRCDYIDPTVLLRTNSKLIEKEISFVKNQDRIYFIKDLDCGILCVTSYPASSAYHEAQYLSKYIFFVCIGVLFFLLIMSTYMAKRLYHPINTLYSDIAENSTNLQKENVSDEIDMLKHVFSEMNAFNSNAILTLKQFDEMSKTFHFRSFLEHCQCRSDFIQDHPYLFDINGNGLCEMLIIKFDITDMNLPVEEEMLFRLNLQEVLRTYLQSSMKGILTKIENDNLALLYLGNEKESIIQTRKVLTDTVVKLTNHNAYFAISQPVLNVEDIIPQFHICLDLMETAYFFNRKNEVITCEWLDEVKESDDIYNLMLRVNTSLIRSIVSQNEYEIDNIFYQLGDELRKLQDAALVKDICNRIMLELDHEFHFNKILDINLLQSLNDKKTLTDLLNFINDLLKHVSRQYGSNDARENNYCDLAKKFLEENYMQDMNIMDVADQLDISYSYLSKIFRIKTSVTLSDYLNNVRIEKSKMFLATTFLTLNEIAEKVGYNNVQSYQRFFKKYLNITPGDYRKLHNK
jgi:YesN/AraC family two-component response regulator